MPNIRGATVEHAALQMILEEHRALRALLAAFLEQGAAAPPDFPTLRAILFYLDEFPEHHHHRQESELLFPRLRARSRLLADLLDQLDIDHAEGQQKLHRLGDALLAYEVLGAPRRAAFEQAARDYVELYEAHMAVEERLVLPLADKGLLAEDWAVLDAAFRAHRDPLSGADSAPDYRDLFARLQSLLPAGSF